MSNFSTELTENHYLATHAVGPNQHGIRLDAFLKQRYRKRSRNIWKAAIASGAISVKRTQGPHVSVGKLKPSSQLLPGDEVLVLSERKPEPPVNFNYRILFQDEHLLVIDKPSHLPVHPAGRYFFNTLLIHLRTYGHEGRGEPLPVVPSEREYFLAHRIDKDTSGVLVLCKTKEACAKLVDQFFERQTEKRYLAIVYGEPKDEFEIDLPLRRAPRSIIELKMATTTPDDEFAMPSLTRFKRLETVRNASGTYSIVECFPKTGRQHQIRVHLETAGYPIVGDKLYGLPEAEAVRFFERSHLSPEAEHRLLIPRHALHAAGIQFDHPITGKRVHFTDELPGDLRNFFEEQRAGTFSAAQTWERWRSSLTSDAPDVEEAEE